MSIFKSADSLHHGNSEINATELQYVRLSFISVCGWQTRCY